jgi:hypothetical protein
MVIAPAENIFCKNRNIIVGWVNGTMYEGKCRNAQLIAGHHQCTSIGLYGRGHKQLTFGLYLAQKVQCIFIQKV